MLCAVLAFALALRFRWFALVPIEDVGDSYQFDMTWYAMIGSKLKNGGGYATAEGPTAFWPPGYPAFIAGVHWLRGRLVPNLADVQIVQVALSAATCGLTYLVGAQLWGRRVGLVAAALLATSLDHAMYATLRLSETLFTFAIVGIAWAHSRWFAQPAAFGLGRGIALGVAVGIASLIRSVGVLLAAALPATWLWTSRSVRLTAAPASLFLLALALTFLPWTLRNLVVMKAPIVLGSQIGEVLAVAHWPRATGCLGTLSGDDETAQREFADAARYRLRFPRLHGAEREVASMRAETSRALKYMLSHPLEEASLVPARIRCLYHDGHSAMRWDRRQDPTAPPGTHVPLLGARWDPILTRLADLHFFAVLGLAVFGTLRARSWHGAAALVPLFVLLTTALHGLLLFGDPRFHVPLLPFLCLLAACAVCPGRRALPA